eukprot:2906077-Amphidinium_carterae.2
MHLLRLLHACSEVWDQSTESIVHRRTSMLHQIMSTMLKWIGLMLPQIVIGGFPGSSSSRDATTKGV